MIINESDEVLIAEEFHYNTFMRKFPGGGLQFGEGIKDCVFRELKEELNLNIKEAEHFYTTDFFVQSAFNVNHQVIGVYYIVKSDQDLSSAYREEYLLPEKNGAENFRWVRIADLQPMDFTFPADQQAARELKKKYEEEIS